MVSLTSSLFFSNIHSLCDVLNKLFLPAISTHLIWLLVRISVLQPALPPDGSLQASRGNLSYSPLWASVPTPSLWWVLRTSGAERINYFKHFSKIWTNESLRIRWKGKSQVVTYFSKLPGPTSPLQPNEICRACGILQVSIPGMLWIPAGINPRTKTMKLWTPHLQWEDTDRHC